MEPFSYPLKDIALVIKRHSHDVRNALNAMELELTLLDDGAIDPATREAVRRLRAAGAEIGGLMQGISSKYGMEPASMVPALQIAERWNADARHVVTEASLDWSIRLGGEVVCTEASLVRSLLKDALEMALRITRERSFQINCRCDDGHAVFEIAARDGNAGAGIINSQQAYWAALCRLAARNHGLMRPVMLSPTGSFPIQLVLPLHQPVS
jgi:light-regulated signal transduction histidine kinase (bacteriophytochrome)